MPSITSFSVEMASISFGVFVSSSLIVPSLLVAYSADPGKKAAAASSWLGYSFALAAAVRCSGVLDRLCQLGSRTPQCNVPPELNRRSTTLQVNGGAKQVLAICNLLQQKLTLPVALGGSDSHGLWIRRIERVLHPAHLV